MTIAQHLARHVVSDHQLDEALVNRIDILILDYLGVTVGGVSRGSADSARRACDLSSERQSARPSRIHGLDLWASMEDAALVNGITAHGLELDDTHEEGSLHPAVAIMPAVFAYADAVHVDALTFRRSIAVGYDVMTSVGVLLGASESYARGFHPTGVSGAVGAAAALSVLMGSTEESTAHALGLAANMSAGSLEFLSDGSWTKRLNAGHAAATGIRAAKLAQAGFLAPKRAFEGRDGFLRQYGEGEIEGRQLDIKFGKGVHETSIKLYPCCRYMHGNIDLLRELHTELPDLQLDDVERIECAVITAGASLVSEPAARKLVVTSPVDAQFNMPFGAAVALTTGRAEVEQFDAAVQVAEDLAGWLEKVHCYESSRLESAFPQSWQAEVKLVLSDGREIERYAEAYLGSPAKPSTLDDVMVKVGSLVSNGWGEVVGSRIVAMKPASLMNSSALLDSAPVD